MQKAFENLLTNKIYCCYSTPTHKFKTLEILFENACFIVILRITYFVIVVVVFLVFFFYNITRNNIYPKYCILYLWFYGTIFNKKKLRPKFKDIKLQFLTCVRIENENNKNFQTKCKQITKGQNWILM